jgi:hypothetical protein
MPTILGLAVALAGLTGPASAQVVTEPPDPIAVAPDPSDVVGSAQAAQASFERRRVRHLPLSYGAPGGTCDEHVGRFCTWYGEGEWYPVPEAPEIIEMRAELISRLDSLQGLAPDSDWILGQRVWYRSEAGDWEAARSTAARCGGAEPWWCAALEGFALHGLGRYPQAESAFERALVLMSDERRDRWTWPRWPVDSDVRDLLQVEPGGADEAIELLWTLADPLNLVPGNDRKTAHFARWTVARLRDRARNPFQIRWGEDLSELTVRHGWELGWERSPTRDFSSIDNVIGHKHPEGRDYMPSGSVLRAPAEADAEQLRADRRSPRSLYAPDYAPVLLPMESQLAVFPRVGQARVVTTLYLPEDTTFHADHDHALPWLDPGDQAGLADRMGLYLLPVGKPGAETEPRSARHVGRATGALILTAAPGDYVISAESWSPALRRAGRMRSGLKVRSTVEDVATLSDLLLLAPGGDPTTLEAAVDQALPRARVRRHEPFGVAWEVSGLGFRPETLEFELSVERADRSVFRRVGEFLRLAERGRPLGLSWTEPAASEPGTSFHSVDLELPPLDEGRYRVRLILRTADRSETVRALDFEVSDPASR